MKLPGTFQRISVTAAVIGLMSMATSASAEPDTLDLQYTCVFPIIEEQAISVSIQADIPSSVPVGVLTNAFKIDAVATVGESSWNGLAFVGSRALKGQVKARASLTGPNLALNLTVPMDIPLHAMPTSPESFEVSASGATPPLVFGEQNAGDIRVEVGDLTMALAPEDMNGKFTGLGEFEAECTLNPGQNPVLRTIRVGESATSGRAMSVAGNTFFAAGKTSVALVGRTDALIVSAGGAVAANLELDQTRGQFKIIQLFSLLGMDADIVFEAVAPLTGTINEGAATLQTRAYISLPKVEYKILGLTVSKGGGPSCRTVAPVELTLTSSGGGSFSASEGGTLTGSYGLPVFEGCGSLQSTVNRVMKGSGNTINLSFTPAE